MADIVAISKQIEFDAGHRVPNHKSKCRNPHGHRYSVIVSCKGKIVETPGASDEGMLVDFSDLKHLMMGHIHDVLDHGFIVYEQDEDMLNSLCFEWHRDDGSHLAWQSKFDWNVIIFPYIPTAENIARWCWEQLYDRISTTFHSNLWLEAVTVFETPTSEATYQGPSEEVEA